MRSRSGLQLVLALIACCFSSVLLLQLRAVGARAIVQHNSLSSSPSIVERLIANVSHNTTLSQTGSDATPSLLLLRAEPTAITALPFVRALPRDQQSELLLQVARMHLFGTDAVSSNATAATLWLRASADAFGNPTAQFLLGALAAASQYTSRASATASAVLHYEFAARGGSVAASMALGYRYLHGYGVPRSCEHALMHYKVAADRVVRAARPIEFFSAPTPFRLDDSCARPPDATDDAHRVAYVQQRARQSSDPRVLEHAASVVLFSGLGGTDTDRDSGREARKLLERAEQLGSVSAKALLGHVYAHGLGGARRDVAYAARLYREALNASNATNAEAANGLGRLVIDGDADDAEDAMALFAVAVRAGHANGVYNAGKLLMASNPQRAREYFEAAADVGHVKAQFQLAQLDEQQRFSSESRIRCKSVVARYKVVSEHAADGIELLAHAASAFSVANDWNHALVLYVAAVEMGYEVAESNAAYLLERQQLQWRWHWQSWWWGDQTRDDVDASALYSHLVQRGVAQRSADAHVRYGDALFVSGHFALALEQYERAHVAGRGMHGRALFSIGYMHEKGLGVTARSLATATQYYALLAEAEPAMSGVAWLLQRTLNVQTWFETLVQRVGNVVAYHDAGL